MYTPRITQSITGYWNASIIDDNATIFVGSFRIYAEADKACSRKIAELRNPPLTPEQARVALVGLRVAVDAVSGADVIVDGLDGTWGGLCYDSADTDAAYDYAANELQRIIDGVTA